MWIETKRGEMWNIVVEDKGYFRVAAYPRSEYEDPHDSFTCGVTLEIFNTRAEADNFFRKCMEAYHVD